ncbi:MAG: hypothetical protein IT442_16630 [Phycisphaeraceae bacterium]|nr:hypothetical protein [Phycisphaeraceae bacterium]
MNRRQMNLAVFERTVRPTDPVFFQPRVEPWFAWHRTMGKLPARYAGMDTRGFMDDLGVSMRYLHYYTDQPDPVRQTFGPAVKITKREESDRSWTYYDTPHGQLVREHVRNEDQVWRTVRYPVQTRDDLACLRWMYRHVTYSFDRQRFDIGDQYIGERGVPQFWLPKSPYQHLAQWWMTLESLIYGLADYPDEVEEAMRLIDDSYDGLYEQLVPHAEAVRIVNFGENLHDQLIGPAYIEKYLLPWYSKRSGQLQRAGIYTHCHIDGYCRTLLRYVKDMPFDGIEALTPQPQGDVTLEEIKEHLGDKILLDGIPAVLFMDQYSREELMACVEKVTKLFHPRLVLGVSDEVPEGLGEEAIERVRMIQRWCQKKR